VDGQALDDLDRITRETGISRNALAGRYISEGAKMDEHPQIYFRSGALGRRAALLGTRLDVWQVIDTLREHGNSIEETASYLGLPPERVRVAVSYYAAQREEIDDIAAREHEAAERAEKRWRAEQELLAS
jgi:uncharacterized protein (DUF433 family)